MKKQEVTVLDFANEVKRLANEVIKDIKLERGLACMSNLAALRTVSQIVMDTVSGAIEVADSAPKELEPKSHPIGFCSSKSEAIA